MKNLSIILNVVLLLAVATLYFIHFYKPGPDHITSAVSSDGGLKDISIAFVNEDTLLNNYDLFKEMAAQLEKKRTELEKAYASRAQGLQTEIDNFQRSAGNMTINQARAIEEDLMRKQQNLMRYQETLSQDLLKEEAKVNDQLYSEVSTFVKEYAQQNGYQYVLNFKRGTGMLYGTEALDITRQVIDGLNLKYKSGKEVTSGVPVSPDSASLK